MVGDHERRALILAPAGRNAVVAASLLQEGGVASTVCVDLAGLVELIGHGAGLVVVTQEALVDVDLTALSTWIAGQPAWSDLPFIVITPRGGGPERNPGERRLLDMLGNVLFVEGPFHPFTLVAISRTALRSRERQYQARSQLAMLAAQTNELKEGEARLAQSEAMFRLMFEQAAVGITLVGLDGRWLRANNRLCAMLDYSETELQTMNFQDLTHPDDLALNLDHARAMRAGQI